MNREEARIELIADLQRASEFLENRGTFKSFSFIKGESGYKKTENQSLPFEFYKDSPLAYAYSHKYSTIIFHEDYFNQIYEEYELFALHNKYIYRTVCYMPNVISINPLELPDGFSLISVDDMYLNYLVSVDRYLSDTFNNNGTLSVQQMLNQHFSPYDASILVHEYVGETGDNALREKVEAILKSLVLSNGVSHSFDISPVYTFSYFNLSSSTMYFQELFFHNSSGLSSIIRLSSKDQEEISYNYSLLRSLGSSTPLSLKRFVSAFTKSAEDDKFIDLVIALESLYPSVRAENTYRIAILTALALRQGYDMYTKVKDIYDYRSGLVHGDKRKAKVTLQEANIIVKKTLRFYLEEMASGKDLQQIENELTFSIFGQKEISEDFFS